MICVYEWKNSFILLTNDQNNKLQSSAIVTPTDSYILLLTLQ